MEAETKNHLLKNISTVINRYQPKNAFKIYGTDLAMARKGLLIFVAVRI
jgi:hypothetical protein